MVKKLIFILAFCVLFVVACKKKNVNYVVKGSVTNALTAETLSDVLVKLTRFPLSGTGPSVIVASPTTLSDGFFSIETKREKTEKYTIEYSKAGYFTKLVDVNIDNLSTEKDNEFSTALNAIGYIKFVLTNASPLITDQFKIFKQGSNTSCDICCSSGYSFYNGAVDTVFYCPANAGSSFKFDWWVNSTASFGSENYTVIAFDTITFTKVY
jgi:hypothetical protein